MHRTSWYRDFQASDYKHKQHLHVELSKHSKEYIYNLARHIGWTETSLFGDNLVNFLDLCFDGRFSVKQSTYNTRYTNIHKPI